MKKILLGAFLLSMSMLNTQKFGIKAGYSHKFKQESGRLESPGSGIDIGGFYTYSLGDGDSYYIYTIQPEIIFSSQKHRIIDRYADGEGYQSIFDGTPTANVNFITLPLMFQVNTGDINSRNLYIEFGPIFYYLLSYKGAFNYRGELQEMRSDYLNKFSMDLGLGMGYYFSKNIGVNIRWILGNSDFFNSEEFLKKGDSTQQGGQRISFPGLQFSLGYKF